MISFDKFKREVEAEGFKAKQCTSYHWQVEGGAFLLNYYPTAKGGPKIYIAGTTGGFHGGLQKALDSLKNKNIPARLEKEGRKHPTHYRRHKRRLLRCSPFCHWCKKPLTAADATIDHKIPLHLGGLNNSNNYVLSCAPCNHTKGHEIW